MVIQTLMPDHHAIEAVRVGSYLKFYRAEIAIRQEHDFPPFTRLARFVYTHRENSTARREALRLAEALNGVLAENRDNTVQLMGPAPCFRARSRRSYRWHILAYGSDEQVSPLLAVPHRGWSVDVDPVDLV